jgi:hypothetical protein
VQAVAWAPAAAAGWHQPCLTWGLGKQFAAVLVTHVMDLVVLRCDAVRLPYPAGEHLHQ